ncbi:MAG: hypothetical protein LBT22_02665 [Peptococcaceae bacterium]|nr:hypothetical protein [Peptococcaceae bacterium]
MTAGEAASALWQEYRFLTKEMLKFVEKDTELFYSLLSQREQLQATIEQTPDEGYISSEAGRGVLLEIREDTDRLQRQFQGKVNHAKRQHQVAEAYRSAPAPENRRQGEP